jgi:hypothetical protein
MEGTISGEDYFVADVPYVMYFDGLGNALHGTYCTQLRHAMSTAASTCHMDVAASSTVWAEVGTAVTVL